jgi:hypothetical protein
MAALKENFLKVVNTESPLLTNASTKHVFEILDYDRRASLCTSGLSH